MRSKVLTVLIILTALVSSKAQTWTEMNGPYGGTPQDYLIDGSGNILASTCNGIFRSTNGGTSWVRSKINGGINGCILDLLLDGSTMYALSGWSIYTSTDGGLIWNKIKNDEDIIAKRIAKNPISGNLLIASFQGVYKSTDQGASIAKVFTNQGVNDITIKPNGDIFIATDNGVYRSLNPNDGLISSWVQVNSGIGGTTTSNSITYDGSGNLYLATNDNLYKSTNNGSNWSSIKGTITQTTFHGKFAISPANTIFFLNTDFGVIYKSTTAGSSWTTINSPAGYYFQSTLMAVDDNTLYAVHYDKGLLKSINGGTNWTLYNQGLTAQNAEDIQIADNGAILLLPYEGIVRSADDGATWTNQGASPADGNFHDLLKLANGTIFAIGTKLIKTIDGGANWTLVNGALPTELRCMITNNETTFYSFGNDGKIYSTINQGTLWSAMTITGLPGSYTGVDLVVAQNGNLYYLIDQSGTRDIYKIVSGVATKLNKPILYADGLEINGNDLMFFEYSTLYKSSDAGVTWSSIFPGTYNNRVMKASSGELLCFGYGLAVSRNGGAQWSYAPTMPYQDRLDEVATVNASGIVYTKSSATGLVKTSAAPVPPALSAPITFNWQHLNGPNGGYIFKMQKDAAGNIYGAQRDIFKLPNGSTTWQNITTSFDFFVWDFIVGASNRLIAMTHNRIRFSTDGGATWTEPAYNQSQRFNDSYIVRESGANLWVAGNSGVWLSTDNGVNWTSKKTGKIYDLEVNASGHIYIISGQGVEKSTNTGTTWTVVNNGITEFPAQVTGNPTPGIEIDPTGNVYCIVPANIYKTTDGGSNWSSIKGTIDNANGSNQLLIVQGSSVFLGLTDNKMYKTDDLGSTWSNVTLPNGFGVGSLVVSGSSIFLNDRNALLEDMFKSDNGGSTWAKIPTGITAGAYIDLEVSVTGRLMVGDGGCGFIASADNAATWTFPTGIGGGVGSFTTLSDGTLLAYGCSFGKSIDNGLTWTPVGTQTTFSIIRVQNDNTFFKWETDFGKFYKSTNAGLTWTEIVITGLPASPTPGGFDVDPDGNLYILYSATLNRDLYKVTNGAATRLDPFGQGKSYAYYYSVKTFKNKIFVYTEWFGKNIYSSADGGATWSAIKVPQSDSFFIDPNGYFFAPKNEERRLYVSYNTGNTWQEISEPGTSFTDVLVDRNGFAYGSSNTSGILKSNAIAVPNDGIGPAISTLLPADNAIDILITSTIEITFDEYATAVSGKKLKVFSGTSTTPVFDVEVTTLVQKEKRFIFDPSTDLKNVRDYHVEIDAGAFVDIFGNAFAGVTDPTSWNFKTIKDPNAPAINHTPVSLQSGAASVNMTVNITDASDITEAKVFYKGILAPALSGTSLQVALNPVTGDQTFTLPATTYDALGAEYNIVATDAGGNTKTTRYYSFINYPADKAITLTDLKFGGTLNDWQIISIPHKFANAGVPTLLDELLPIDIDRWRLITYKKKDEWLEFPGNFTNIEQGKGYFLNIREVTTVKIENAETPNNNQANLFKLNLIKGWNQIGNPYTIRIDWPNVLSYNSGVGVDVSPVGTLLTKYNSGYKQSENFLRPFEGGFVLSDKEVTLEIPLTGNTAGRRGEIFSSQLESDNWKIDFQLRQEQASYPLGAIGMHPDAKPGKDQFDGITPPRFFNFLEMNSLHREFFMPKFTRDIVPSSPQHIWSFDVVAEIKGTTEISWNNSPFASSLVPIFLVDPEAVQVVDMRSNSSYSFELTGEGRKLEIYYGQEPRASQFSVGNPYPNPFIQAVRVPFSLPEGQQSYEVKMEVYNSTGQRVGVFDGTYPSGYQEIEWTGTTAEGLDLPTSLYFVNLIVDSGSASQKRSCRIIKK